MKLTYKEQAEELIQDFYSNKKDIGILLELNF